MQPYRLQPFLALLGTLLLAACSVATVATPTVAATGLAVTTTPADPVVTPEPVQELILWVAPAFAPDLETVASQLFAARLEAFLDSHPDVSISVRAKSSEGRSGLLETLISANLAAPETLPDLITLNQETLAAAAAESILLPLDMWGTSPTTDGWYDFALDAARINGTFFGIPFVGDADIFAYRSARFSDAPLTWTRLLDENALFCLPLGDPLATYTLAEYQHIGGSLTDEAGDFILDAGILSNVLAFYETAQSAQLLTALSQTSTSPEDCWDALAVDIVSAGVVPLENVIQQVGTSLAAVPIPTGGDTGLSFVNTWSWAMTSQRPERQDLASELASWLSDPAFVGEWSQALGYLPAQTDALAIWENEQQLALASSLVTLVSVHPAPQLLLPFSEVLTIAIEDVLTQGISPSTAANAAAQMMQK